MNEFEKVKTILYMGVGRTGLEDENKVISRALNYYAKHLSQYVDSEKLQCTYRKDVTKPCFEMCSHRENGMCHLGL